MSQGALPLDAQRRAFAHVRLGRLDDEALEALAAAAGDIVLLIDAEGVIRDLAVASRELAADGVQAWVGQRWLDTATVDSRHKIEDLLREARAGATGPWREVNQVNPRHNALIVRYIALSAGAGAEGRVIAIGRDDRAISSLQQRLIEAQQGMERDYARLRDAESRYRLLCQIAGEGIVVVDPASRRILEVNPAVERLTGQSAAKLVGEPFARLFDAASQTEAASLVANALTAPRAAAPSARLIVEGREVEAVASPFRNERSTHCLVRLAPDYPRQPGRSDDSAHVHAVIERMPDALVITDTALTIKTANSAFLDIVHIPTKDQVVGRSMNDFLGRAPAERALLVGNAREHGYVRNYATVMRDRYEEPQDVELSVVSAEDGGESWFGFHIRVIRPQPAAERPPSSPDLHRSVEQLTELVGRVKLKELVRETTDIVERLCIEAALELTKNNRASAAELLGLSRQSLYSKLNRFARGREFTDE